MLVLWRRGTCKGHKRISFYSSTKLNPKFLIMRKTKLLEYNGASLLLLVEDPADTKTLSEELHKITNVCFYFFYFFEGIMFFIPRWLLCTQPLGWDSTLTSIKWLLWFICCLSEPLFQFQFNFYLCILQQQQTYFFFPSLEVFFNEADKVFNRNVKAFRVSCSHIIKVNSRHTKKYKA